MKKYNLVSSNLKEGQKVTLVWQSEFGGMTAVPTIFLGCQPALHYQTCPDDMIGAGIFHKPKGGRKVRYTVIGYNTPLIVYDGWHDIDTNSIVFKPLDDQTEVSRYTMHDDRYFTDLLAARPDGVIFADIEVWG